MRVVIPGLPHHITQRGNRRQHTFFHDGDDGNADYAYDDTNQLIATDYEENWQDDEQYVYDDNGNREQVTYDANPPLDYTEIHQPTGYLPSPRKEEVH